MLRAFSTLKLLCGAVWPGAAHEGPGGRHSVLDFRVVCESFSLFEVSWTGVSLVFRMLFTVEDDLVTVMRLDSFFRHESDCMLVSTKDSVKLCCFVSSQAWDLARFSGLLFSDAGPSGRSEELLRGAVWPGAAHEGV